MKPFVIHPKFNVLYLFEVKTKDKHGVEYITRVASSDPISQNMLEAMRDLPSDSFYSFDEIGYQFLSVRNIGVVSILKEAE
jgi:hypothetical protein